LAADAVQAHFFLPQCREVDLLLHLSYSIDRASVSSTCKSGVEMSPRKASAAKSKATRRRIVTAAAEAFRERGFEGVGVRDIMKRAGLTQGGFYFHFPDKDALFKEASREAALSSVAEYMDIADRAPEGKKLHAFIDAYLSLEHRDHPGNGCMMSALGAEAGRGDTKLRAAFNSAVDIVLDRVATYVSGDTPLERRQKAGLLMASLAGVLMVSRVLTNPKSSESLLANARRFFTASFGESQQPS
jgi:TetR/AcrR family transcriptional regulator, transcriptional repressor for nem operon